MTRTDRRLDVVMHTSRVYRRRWRQEDQKFEASLGYTIFSGAGTTPLIPALKRQTEPGKSLSLRLAWYTD